ncbi:phage tail protein [Acinetobacter baumannii]|uniref:Phage tail protein n=1 Tax=Acinetobacter baumannii TaxID=470 RepID=A0A7X1VMI6_ACIBA|nr:phage tail protein [Acinetobacter baumannii]MQQ72605.1 phage tail protein [Acinetobacter baumannii]MQR14947.1 phage tail protein [Acinetobacter baumannii]MQR51231.1 phage tail protein [Acinetobacter baumannii]
MTKQVINVGSAANDGSGTPARTAFQYVNANFSELYDFLTGTTNANTLPAALPIAKGGTGGNTASGAKAALGLGDAGVLGYSGNIIASLYDKVSVPQWVAALGDHKFAFISSGDWQGGNVNNPLNMPSRYGSLMSYLGSNSYGTYSWQIFKPIFGGQLSYRYGAGADSWTAWGHIKTSFNTSVDANGFLKSASPVVKLFNDHIELNSDAEKQPIEFKKVDVGDYLLKGSLGFAQEGWYIEVPKDANGNTIVAVVYDTLENGDLSIKTYKRKFDFELAAVVADLEIPTDIPEGRWIDIRLHEEIVLEETLPDDIEQ